MAYQWISYLVQIWILCFHAQCMKCRQGAYWRYILRTLGIGCGASNNHNSIFWRMNGITCYWLPNGSLMSFKFGSYVLMHSAWNADNVHIEATLYALLGLDVDLSIIILVYFHVWTASLAGGFPMDPIFRIILDLIFWCTEHEMQTRCILTLRLTHPGDWMWS